MSANIAFNNGKKKKKKYAFPLHAKFQVLTGVRLNSLLPLAELYIIIQARERDLFAFRQLCDLIRIWTASSRAHLRTRSFVYVIFA